MVTLSLWRGTFFAAIARADRLYLTEVALEPRGDVRFPKLDPTRWWETKREAGVRSKRDEADFAFVDYERAGALLPGVQEE